MSEQDKDKTMAEPAAEEKQVAEASAEAAVKPEAAGDETTEAKPEAEAAAEDQAAEAAAAPAADEKAEEKAEEKTEEKAVAAPAAEPKKSGAEEVMTMAAGVGNAKLVYFLYLAGLILGPTGIVGVVIAYLNRGDADDVAKSHYTFQIRTFWMGFLWIVLGSVLSAFFVGFFILLFWMVWLVVRCVVGLKAANKGEKIPNETSWLFGN